MPGSSQNDNRGCRADERSHHAPSAASAWGAGASRLVAEQEALERRVRPLELGDLDTLVGRMGVAGRARAEVQRVEAPSREVGDVRPRLFRLDLERAGPPQALDDRRVEGDARCGRVLQDLYVAADELAH